MDSDFSEIVVEAEHTQLVSYWHSFVNTLDPNDHVNPALVKFYQGLIDEAMAISLINNSKDELTDTEAIRLTTLSVCDFVLKFGLYLNGIDFNLKDLTACPCENVQ